MANVQFAQVFWNPTFGDYSGFEVVCEYVRTGRHACASVAEFLKARAQIEETYAKQLAALVKNQSNVKLEGTLGKSWDSIVTNAQKTSAIHQKLADVMNQKSHTANQLTKTLKQKAKQKEDEVRLCQQECRSLHEKALKNKNEYIKRADQIRVLEDDKERTRKDASFDGNTSLSKEIQKLDVSIKKAVTSADTCKQQCNNILEQLDMAKEQWEVKTYNAFIVFNELERNRIIYLRSLLWSLMNVICQTCVDIDKECDSVRNVLLKCDPDSDLEQFICARKTGEKRPATITFDNLGTNVTSSGTTQRSFKTAFGKKLGNAWKSANGQSASINLQEKSAASKTPPMQKGTFQRMSLGRLSGSQEYSIPDQEECKTPIVTSVINDNLIDKANGSDNGFQQMPSSMNQLQHQKVTNTKPPSSNGMQCLVVKNWEDNQGTVLISAGTKARLLEKSNEALWLIELDDHQTLYCPIEYIQEISK